MSLKGSNLHNQPSIISFRSDDSHTFSKGLNNVACVWENHKWLLYWCYHAFLSWSLLQASKLSSLMEQQVSKFDCGPIPDFTSLPEVLLLGRTPSSFPNNLDVEYNLDQARCCEHSLGQNENPCQVWCLCFDSLAVFMGVQQRRHDKDSWMNSSFLI